MSPLPSSMDLGESDSARAKETVRVSVRIRNLAGNFRRERTRLEFREKWGANEGRGAEEEKRIDDAAI